MSSASDQVVMPDINNVSVQKAALSVTDPCGETEIYPANEVDSPEASLPLPLTPYVGDLPIPAKIRPDRWGRLKLYMLPANVQLHPELPASTKAWTYHYSPDPSGIKVPLGPTIEVREGQKLRVDFTNALFDGESPAQHPVVAVHDLPVYVRYAGTEEFHAPENLPGFTCGKHDHTVPDLPPWTVVHLHGGRTDANSDGWPENAIYPGQTQHDVYTNNQPGTMLWYHDHGMGITRLNVYAGLAGLYFIRAPQEEALGLPCRSPYEIPLVIQDRALTCEGDHGGEVPPHQLLHKTGTAGGDPIPVTEGSDVTVDQAPMEFFGPLTMVNGCIWPRHAIRASVYRLRILNGSNARTYRLRFTDAEGTLLTVPMQMLGSDGGLLARPVDLNVPERPFSGSITLAPAERVDVLVDFSGFANRSVELRNFAGSPFGGADASLDDPLSEFLPYPQVMRFDVGASRNRYQFLPEDTELLPSARPWELAEVMSSNHAKVQRLMALVEDDNGVLQLMECTLQKDADGHPVVWAEGDPLPQNTLALRQPGQDISFLYCLLPGMFNDPVRYLARDGDVEIWKVINLSGDTHPVHVHLIQFKLLARDRYSEPEHDTGDGYETHFDTSVDVVALDEADRGWKDTIRVDPMELVTLAIPFRDYAANEVGVDDGRPIGVTGRYVYHCHILEHEDHEMMRPYVVMPPAVIDHMHRYHDHMGGMNGGMMEMDGTNEPSGWYMPPQCPPCKN